MKEPSAVLVQTASTFSGHNGKSRSGPTGMGGFNGGVEGQQIGLKGDTVDVFDDVLRFPAGLRNLRHRRSQPGDDVLGLSDNFSGSLYDESGHDN
jgi:hypothetical protein